MRLGLKIILSSLRMLPHKNSTNNDKGRTGGEGVISGTVHEQKKY